MHASPICFTCLIESMHACVRVWQIEATLIIFPIKLKQSNWKRKRNKRKGKNEKKKKEKKREVESGVEKKLKKLGKLKLDI